MRYVLYILLTVVTIMSGLLSLFREMVGIYAPTMIFGGNLFWACARIAFGLAMVSAWVIEHRKVAALERRFSAPNLKCELRIATGDLNEGGRKTGSVVIAHGIISNPTGPPTALFEWTLELQFSDSRVIRGMIPVAPRNDITFPVPGLGSLVLPRSTYWLIQTATQPIVSGGIADGWMLAYFRGIEQSDLYNGVQATVTVHDAVSGKSHAFSRNIDRSGQPPVAMPS
jgi:hypothetical protein